MKKISSDQLYLYGQVSGSGYTKVVVVTHLIDSYLLDTYGYIPYNGHTSTCQMRSSAEPSVALMAGFINQLFLGLRYTSQNIVTIYC